MTPGGDLVPVVPSLEAELGSIVRVGLITAAPVAVGPSAPPLLAEIGETVSALVAANSGKAPSDIPGLGPARDLYRAFGIDPTHTRPSSEAMLRRLLQGKPFPRILNAVDVVNLAALRFLLSIGLYDAARIRGTVTLRRGRPGEAFAGIRKESVNLGGRPVLADDEGPFGNPTSDSLRTSVTEATNSLWMVIFAPAAYPVRDLEAHVRASRGLIERHLSPPGATAATHGSIVPTP